MAHSVLSIEQIRGRAKNAVANLLIRHLIVPYVYINAPWPSPARPTDVAAVDRSGSGDMHVVKVAAVHAPVTDEHIRAMFLVPAHYRWVAWVAPATKRDIAVKTNELYPSDGIGRIGLIRIYEHGDDLSAEIVTKAERFVVLPQISTKVEQFVRRHKPDIDFL